MVEQIVKIHNNKLKIEINCQICVRIVRTPAIKNNVKVLYLVKNRGELNFI